MRALTGGVAESPIRISVVKVGQDQRDVDVALLREHGYRVNGAVSVSDVAAAAIAAFPDLFLINVCHRKAEGLVLTQQIRQRSSRTGIVLLLPSDDGLSKVSAFASGADNYLIKPYASEELLAVIASLARRLC